MARAARMAAAHGANVAIVEDLYFGGTCVKVGSVPKNYTYMHHNLVKALVARRVLAGTWVRSQHLIGQL